MTRGTREARRGVAVIVAASCAALLWSLASAGVGQAPAAGEYVGSITCEGCHMEEPSPVAGLYRGSAHEAATPEEGATGAELYRRVTIGPSGEPVPGVGCEACHGAGRKHRQSGMPRHLAWLPRDGDKPTFIATCAQCHAEGTMPGGEDYPVGYAPGGPLPADFALTEGATGPFARYNEFVGSKHFASGTVACTDCHNPHGSPDNPSMLSVAGDAICAPCHAEETSDPAAHRPDDFAEGCVGCHMPGGSHAGM
jgi:predicted CXXCH cytochrome family protein